MSETNTEATKAAKHLADAVTLKCELEVCEQRAGLLDSAGVRECQSKLKELEDFIFTLRENGLTSSIAEVMLIKLQQALAALTGDKP